MAEIEFILPKEKVPKKTDSPENIIIYGKPKTGKTTMCANLENCLLIDLERGSNKVDAVKVQANSLQELAKIIQAVRKASSPYKYVAIDSVTQLEAWCEWDATQDYMRTPMGKSFNRYEDKYDETGKQLALPRSQWESVLTLPKGGGYLYLRNSFKKWLNLLLPLAPHVILIAHVKDASVDIKGKEVTVNDLDLTGKIKQIVAQDADAIGYAFWEDGKLMLSFRSKDGSSDGSRCAHLANQVIPFEWDRIFID